jgi:hypothetical protein
LLNAAQTIQADPIEIDQLLTELSAKGWAVYRPWERGYILELLDKLTEGVQAKLSEADVGTFQQAMRRNLKQMVQFAEKLGPGDCRREFILKHFDENLQARPTPCCDLCNPNLLLPWQDVPSEEIPSLPAEVNPGYIALRAVEWNETLRSRQFTKPYTETTLAHILKGNAYAAALHEQDPVKKLRRIKRLEASPYYGVLQGIKGGEKTILQILSKLRNDGYTYLETIAFESSEGEISYHSPILNKKGREQVQSGKYLD